MKVTLHKSDYDKILSHARENFPEEACGLLAGHDVQEDGQTVRHVEEVFLLENTDHSREHFTMSPQAQLKVVTQVRKEGLQILGNWHSHPESPSRPSDEDKRLCYDSKISYMILSLMDPEEPVLHSFHVEGHTMVTKEQLVIVD